MTSATDGAGSAAAHLAGTWEIDATHSNVEFAVTHLMISRVRGRFGEISGTVTTDGTPEGSHVDVSIPTASVSTHDDARDAHLRSADFFDAEKFPQMHFESTSIKPRGDDEYRVAGNLTIRDVTRPVELEVTREGSGKDPWGSERAGFSITTRIDRRDFGLNWNQVLEAGGVLVSNEVKVTIDVELTHKSERQ